MSDNSADVWLRARGLIDRHFTAILIGLVLVAALGGFLTYDAHGTPTEETYTEQVSAWESTGEFAHQATVVNGSQAFALGEVLENRSVYFHSATPVLDGEFRYTYSSTDGGSVDVGSEIALVIRSVSEEGGNESEYWRYSRELNRANRSLQPGESLRANFSQNLSRVQQEIDGVESRIGQGPGTIEALIVVTVDLEGTRNGREVDRGRTYRLPVSFQEGYYRVEDPGPETHSGQQLAQRVRSVPPGAIGGIGGPLLFLLGLVGLGGLTAGRYDDRFELTHRERDLLAYRRARAEFDEWISEAHVPRQHVADAETHVETTSLDGLVDIAIDIDRRVLEMRDRAQFLVMDGNVVYSYEPPARPESEERL